MKELLYQEATELLENKLAFIYNIDSDGLTLVINGEFYRLALDWLFLKENMEK